MTLSLIHGGSARAATAHSPSPLSLTPRLQPGVMDARAAANRVNGFSNCGQTVETALYLWMRMEHRAEATVLMRRSKRHEMTPQSLFQNPLRRCA